MEGDRGAQQSSGFAGWSPGLPRLPLLSAPVMWQGLLIDGQGILGWFFFQKHAWEFVYCALRRLLVLSWSTIHQGGFAKREPLA